MASTNNSALEQNDRKPGDSNEIDMKYSRFTRAVVEVAESDINDRITGDSNEIVMKIRGSHDLEAAACVMDTKTPKQ